MYQVIIVLDETRNRSYYYSYQISNDTTLANITVDELPPFADVNKARACYWDSANSAWVYDEEKYTEICETIAAEEAAREQAEAEAASVPSNAELMEALMEIAQNQSDLADAVSELGDVVAGLTE